MACLHHFKITLYWLGVSGCNDTRSYQANPKVHGHPSWVPRTTFFSFLLAVHLVAWRRMRFFSLLACAHRHHSRLIKTFSIYFFCSFVQKKTTTRGGVLACLYYSGSWLHCIARSVLWLDLILGGIYSFGRWRATYHNCIRCSLSLCSGGNNCRKRALL